MGQGRLRPEFLERTEAFSDRCVAVAERLFTDGRFPRLVEQVAASGSAVGANVAEASEAMSRKDLRKCLSIAAKELSETRFWLRLFIRRGWVQAAQVSGLMSELTEIKLVIGSILTKTDPAKDLAAATRRSEPV